jgi:hypothetical protein
MARPGFDSRTGGVALIVGYAVLLLALFRNPGKGLETATATLQGGVFFVVFPVLGLASGVYLLLGREFRTVIAFCGGSYLGVVGVAMTMLPAANAVLTTVLGLFLMAVAVFALVASLRSSVATLAPEGFFEL